MAKPINEANSGLIYALNEIFDSYHEDERKHTKAMIDVVTERVADDNRSLQLTSHIARTLAERVCKIEDRLYAASNCPQDMRSIGAHLNRLADHIAAVEQRTPTEVTTFSGRLRWLFTGR